MTPHGASPRHGRGGERARLEMPMTWMLFAGYLLTVPAANWTVANVGTACLPDGPCLIPVGWGLTAPSGVLWIGLALCLRDGVHEALGRRWALLAVLLGSALSFAVSPPFVAVASSVAFLVSELADTLVYGRLRERGLVWALIASNLVGLTIDSAAFLWIAFGSLDFIAGQLWAKVVMTGLAAMVIVAWKGYRINSEIAAWDRG